MHHDVGDILELVGFKMFSRELIKLEKIQESRQRGS